MSRPQPTCLVLALLAGVACHAEPQLPGVRAEGRFVRYAADDDDVFCAGTVDAIDVFVAQVFDTLGREPPESAFITYYWLPDGSEMELCGADVDAAAPNCAHELDGESVVYSHNVLNRHELVHAVHFTALGPGPGFLQEGLAQLYGDQLVDPSTWPEGVSIDEALTGDDVDYLASWRIVHAIVQRHGVEQLERYWQRASAVRPDDAAGLRTAFTEVLGEDIEDALAATESQLPCTIPLCNVVAAQASAPWELEAAGSCDDPRAVGGRRSSEPVVTNEGVFALPSAGTHPFDFEGVEADDRVDLRRCDDTCNLASDAVQVFPGSTGSLELDAGLWRVIISNRSGTTPSRFALHSP